MRDFWGVLSTSVANSGPAGDVLVLPNGRMSPDHSLKVRGKEVQLQIETTCHVTPKKPYHRRDKRGMYEHSKSVVCNQQMKENKEISKMMVYNIFFSGLELESQNHRISKVEKGH